MSAIESGWPGKLPPAVETLVVETVEMIHDLDGVGLNEMTPVFYQHGYEQLRSSVEELLKFLGHDPDA